MKDSLPLKSPIQYLKGVGPKKAKIFSNLGIKTIEDLLYYFPRSYHDRTKIKSIFNIREGDKETIFGVVVKHLKSSFPRKRIKINKVVIGDGTGTLSLLFFNQPYIEELLPKGCKIIVSGNVRRYGREYQMTTFEYEKWEEDELIHNKRIVPLYRLSIKTPSNWQRVIRKTVKSILDTESLNIEETIPPGIIKKYNLFDLKSSLENIHFPSSWKDYQEAKKRLIFEEFFYLQLALGYLRQKIKKEETGISHKIDKEKLKDLCRIFPFSLTNGQLKAIYEISKDMESNSPMCRLLHGDVGSGKTVVAIIASLIAIYNNSQVAFMVPTEVLAEQHYLNLRKLFNSKNINIALLTSNVKGKERKNILENLASGILHMVIGTHSLIQKEVNYKKLGLCIIDEQHRFGVLQRLALQRKGTEKKPDILVMSATPIPRTLALTLYGDLDISTISQLPPNRKEIRNFCRSEKDLPKIYQFIKREIQKGRQAYIIYPLINESKEMNLKSATKMVEKLREKVFPDLSLGLLHGKLKISEKEEVMNKFKNREIDILISTTVIEVGIDVPNATIMLIEHAERFGLSQLHQLRGRIGRGEYNSYCIFITKRKIAEAVNNSYSIEGELNSSLNDAIKRLKTIISSCNGFKIAEADFEIRGPGELFGLKQHGIPQFRIANLIRDVDYLKMAKEEVDILISQDPSFQKEENRKLFQNFKNNYLPYIEKELLLE